MKQDIKLIKLKKRKNKKTNIFYRQRQAHLKQQQPSRSKTINLKKSQKKCQRIQKVPKPRKKSRKLELGKSLN